MEKKELSNGTANIIIDTREQHPWAFKNSVRRALPSGDYSLEGLEDCFAIERKSLADWVNTVVHNKRRFRAELTRLQAYEFAAVVIESSYADILRGDYRSDIAPQALLGITVGLMQAYHPVHFVMAGDRPHAYAVVAELLKLGAKRYGGAQCRLVH
jgi:ERCC4-type nuclease